MEEVVVGTARTERGNVTVTFEKVEGPYITPRCRLLAGFRNYINSASHSQARKGSVMYKSQLQEYAQKAAIPPPVYEFVKEGASHEPRFKAIVILNNVTYESPPGFPNLKSAEHAAAKAALDGLLQTTGGTGVTPSPVHESGLCKNLLQEYAQKNSLPLPVYQSQRSGEDHAPTFTSSVEIAGVKYSGGSAKNKKEAEIKAARTALLAIQSAQSSAPVPAPAPEPPITVAAPQAQQVGLATYISTNLNNNAPGKKRGRGATNSAIADEPTATRHKYIPQVPQAASQAPQAEVPVKSVATPAVTAVTSIVEAPASVNPVVTPTVPKVPQQPVTTPVKLPSVDIADLFATPGAKKILGVGPKPPQTENSHLSQGTSSLLLAPEQTNTTTTNTNTAASSSLSPADAISINMDSQGNGNTLLTNSSLSPAAAISDNTDSQENSNILENRIAEEGVKATIAPEVQQIELVSGESDQMQEDQAFMQAAQSAGLISLTG